VGWKKGDANRSGIEPSLAGRELVGRGISEGREKRESKAYYEFYPSCCFIIRRGGGTGREMNIKEIKEKN